LGVVSLSLALSGCLINIQNSALALGVAKQQLTYLDSFFCTLTALKSLTVAPAMVTFFALLAHKITSSTLSNLLLRDPLVHTYIRFLCSQAHRNSNPGSTGYYDFEVTLHKVHPSVFRGRRAAVRSRLQSRHLTRVGKPPPDSSWGSGFGQVAVRRAQGKQQQKKGNCCHGGWFYFCSLQLGGSSVTNIPDIGRTTNPGLLGYRKTNPVSKALAIQIWISESKSKNKANQFYPVHFRTGGVAFVFTLQASESGSS